MVVLEADTFVAASVALHEVDEAAVVLLDVLVNAPPVRGTERSWCISDRSKLGHGRPNAVHAAKVEVGCVTRVGEDAVRRLRIIGDGTAAGRGIGRDTSALGDP